MSTRTEIIAREALLLQYAEAHREDGFTRAEVTEALGCTSKQLDRSIADLRQTLADSDRWLGWEAIESRYRLVGDYDDAASARHYQLNDLASRLVTARGAARSQLRATSPDDPDHIWADLVMTQVDSMFAARSALQRLRALERA